MSMSTTQQHEGPLSANSPPMEPTEPNSFGQICGANTAVTEPELRRTGRPVWAVRECGCDQLVCQSRDPFLFSALGT
jgi:hypothetical protein